MPKYLLGYMSGCNIFSLGGGQGDSLLFLETPCHGPPCNDCNISTNRFLIQVISPIGIRKEIDAGVFNFFFASIGKVSVLCLLEISEYSF